MQQLFTVYCNYNHNWQIHNHHSVRQNSSWLLYVIITGLFYLLDFVLSFGGKEVGGGHVTSQCGVLLRQMFCFRGGALVQQPWMRVACRCPRSSPAWASPPAQQSCLRPTHPCWILGREGRWTQAGEGMYVVFVAGDSDWQTTWGDTSGFTLGRNPTSVLTVPIEPHRNSQSIDIFAQFMQIFSYYKNPQWVLWMLLVHLLAFLPRLTFSLTLDLTNLNWGGLTPALKKDKHINTTKNSKWENGVFACGVWVEQ